MLCKNIGKDLYHQVAVPHAFQMSASSTQKVDELVEGDVEEDAGGLNPNSSGTPHKRNNSGKYHPPFSGPDPASLAMLTRDIEDNVRMILLGQEIVQILMIFP